MLSCLGHMACCVYLRVLFLHHICQYILVHVVNDFPLKSQPTFVQHYHTYLYKYVIYNVVAEAAHAWGSSRGLHNDLLMVAHRYII